MIYAVITCALIIPIPVKICRKDVHDVREKAWIPAFAGITELNIRQIQIRIGITVCFVISSCGLRSDKGLCPARTANTGALPALLEKLHRAEWP